MHLSPAGGQESSFSRTKCTYVPLMDIGQVVMQAQEGIYPYVRRKVYIQIGFYIFYKIYGGLMSLFLLNIDFFQKIFYGK